MRWLVFVGNYRDIKHAESDHAVNLDEADADDWGLCVMRLRKDKLVQATGYVVVEAVSEKEAIAKVRNFYVIDGRLQQVDP